MAVIIGFNRQKIEGKEHDGHIHLFIDGANYALATFSLKEAIDDYFLKVKLSRVTKEKSVQIFDESHLQTEQITER